MESVSAQFKTVILSSAYRLGIFNLLRLSQRNRINVLMYHRFSAEPEMFKVSQQVFANQIDFLRQRYNFISFNDYLNTIGDDSQTLPSNPILITIDDGYRDNYEYAFPILKEMNVPATIFLATDFVSHNRWLWSNKLEFILKNSLVKRFDFHLGKQLFPFQVDTFSGWHHSQLKIFNYCRTINNESKDRLLEQLANQLQVRVPTEVTDDFASLSWDQIREMHAAGIEFGSHTCSHPICSRLEPADLKTELIESKQTIERRLSAAVDVFCYPNGQPEDYSDEVVDAVRSLGYRAAVTTVTGFNDLTKFDPLKLKRLSLSTDVPAVMSRELTR